MLSRIKWLPGIKVLAAVNFAIFCLLLPVAWKIYFYETPKRTPLDLLIGRQPEPQFVDYKDFISIMLTGLSAMITALGIGLAVIAIWGFSQIKDEARKAAEKIARTAAEAVAREAAERMFFELVKRRQSGDEFRAQYDRTPGASEETVQNLVEALTGDSDDEAKRR